MRTRISVSLLAVVLASGVFGVPSARADGYASSEAFSVTLKGLPDTCPPGETMVGEATILLNDLRLGPIARPQRVTVIVFLETIVGPVIVYKADFFMKPGSQRVLQIEIPVAADAEPGRAVFEMHVTVDDETLRVGHEVEITK